MKFGVFPFLDPSSGGVYQYSLSILQGCEVFAKRNPQHKFVIISQDHFPPDLPFLNSGVFSYELMLFPPSQFEEIKKTSKRLLGEKTWYKLRKGLQILKDFDNHHIDLRFSNFLQKLNIDLMIYPAPVPFSFQVDVPFIMAIHDLQHRLQPQFTEVSANGEWERREFLFRNACHYGTVILADSQIGKEDILRFYGEYTIPIDKVRILPYVPASYIAKTISTEEIARVRMLYHLPEQYLFYPAQFWPHKNHLRIIQALALLKTQHGHVYSLVLCGSHSNRLRKNTFDEVMREARRNGVISDILYLGMVPNEHMAALYAGGRGLIFPTFFGPTNIPIIEAWNLGCPVITSDIRGIREQVGDAGILIDPNSVESIAAGIRRLWSDSQLRESIIQKGREKTSNYSSKDFTELLIEIIEGAIQKVNKKSNKNEFDGKNSK